MQAEKGQKKYVVGARPPKRLSQEAKNMQQFTNKLKLISKKKPESF